MTVFTHEHESMACPLCGAYDILWVEDLPARVVQQTEIKEILVTHEEHRAYAYCRQIEGAISRSKSYIPPLSPR